MVELPLLERGAADGLFCRISPSINEPALIPSRLPAQGEQYRFHFNMSKCIGCKCCVVACNEQNGNPAAINWRRVGELEGGSFPYTERLYLSTGCNHCMEPSCMIGCPVNAYTKDAVTGIVDHDPDICIGCQYCTWNCSYGVPQFNAERGVVGKCDMCHHRLTDGLAPACVNACPEGSIEIEIVNLAQWRQNFEAANAPGLPSASDSISTTRVTLPEKMPANLMRVDRERVRPAEPHWSLVAVLVMSQWAIGAFAALNGVAANWLDAATAFAVVAIALAAAPLHLGRPALAYRAVKGWRTSWLSREILSLSAFAAAALAFTALLWVGDSRSLWAGLAAALLGSLGILSSARIYMVPARPAWNLFTTLPEFYMTALALGPAFVAAMGHRDIWLGVAAACGGAAQAGLTILKLRSMRKSVGYELQSAAKLLDGTFNTLLRARVALALLGALSSVFVSPFGSILGFLLLLSSEVLGRYLFFVAVMPKGTASTFLQPGRAA